eukprot:1178477-Prorocentrum_minimum.AAC.1
MVIVIVSTSIIVVIIALTRKTQCQIHVDKKKSCRPRALLASQEARRLAAEGEFDDNATDSQTGTELIVPATKPIVDVYDRSQVEASEDQRDPQGSTLIEALNDAGQSSQLETEKQQLYIKEEENLPGPGVRCSARLQHVAAEKAMVAVALYESELKVVRNQTLRALVLFSGSGSVERALQQRFPRIRITSLDIDPKSAATQICDIRQFVQTESPAYSPGDFDLIWASPPCTEYSRAMTTRPRDLAAADLLVASTLACLVYLKSTFWFIENPEGLLSTRPIMIPYESWLHRVSYCHYGTPYRKHTHIWSNVPNMVLKRCTNDTPCQQRAKEGRHSCTAQAGPSGDVPGSGIGKRVYAVPSELLGALFNHLPW